MIFIVCLVIFMLYYKGKSRKLDNIVEASMHLLTPIEIVPFNQNRFDIVTFIEEKLKGNKVLTLIDKDIQGKILNLKIMLFDPDYDDAEKAPISEITKSNYYL